MPRVHGNFAFTLEVPNLPDQCEGVYYALGQITLKRARSPPSAHREEPVPERARRLLVRADNAAGEPGEPAAEGPHIIEESPEIQQGGMMGESAEAEQEEPSQPRQSSQPGPSQPRQPSALMTRFLSMPWRHRMAEAEEDGATKMAEAEEAEAEEAEMAEAQEIWARRLAIQETEEEAEEAEMPEEEAEEAAAEMDTQTVRDSVPVAFAGAIDVEDTCSAPAPGEMTDAQQPWIPSPEALDSEAH